MEATSCNHGKCYHLINGIHFSEISFIAVSQPKSLFGKCYHTANVFSFSQSQSDHINRCLTWKFPKLETHFNSVLFCFVFVLFCFVFVLFCFVFRNFVYRLYDFTSSKRVVRTRDKVISMSAVHWDKIAISQERKKMWKEKDNTNLLTFFQT